MTLFVKMAVGIALTLAAASAQAQSDLIVEKKTFELPTYTTAGGATIKGVKVGWESYGELNADRSNAILVTHFFSGTSHAAGKYKPEDRAPGYWDPIIGPGKAIDTNRYFVISSDTLVNLSPKDPNVVTTGPATIDPATGKPYGLELPGGFDPRFRQCPEGASRQPRHPQAQGGGRRFDGSAPGL